MTTFDVRRHRDGGALGILDPAALRRVFGAFPSGVVAVASHIDGSAVGLAASSFTSVSLTPPLVSVSIAKASKTWPVLRRAGQIGITVLAEHQGWIGRQLSRAASQRFDGVGTIGCASGALLVSGGVAQFECCIWREIDAGDHVIVLLEVHAALGSDDKPLVFHQSAFGGLK